MCCQRSKETNRLTLFYYSVVLLVDHITIKTAFNIHELMCTKANLLKHLCFGISVHVIKVKTKQPILFSQNVGLPIVLTVVNYC